MVYGAQDIEHVSEALKHQLTLLRDAVGEPLRLPAALSEYTQGDTPLNAWRRWMAHWRMPKAVVIWHW